MIKIKLQERQTVSANQELTDVLTEHYIKNFLKLVERFLKYKHEKTKKDSYLETLNQIKEKYANYFGQDLSIGKSDFIDKLNKSGEKISYVIARFPVDKIIPHILTGDTVQKALISARMDEEEATDQIQAYFKQKDFKHVDFDLEISEPEEKFGGLMDYRFVTISIIYPDELFKKILFHKKDIDQFINDVEHEVLDTKRKVYHELQHFSVDVIQKITGFNKYGLAPQQASRGNLPNNDSREVQTYAQEAVTIFNDMIKNLKIKPKQIQATKNTLLKKILKSSLSPEEEKLLQTLDQDIIKKHIKLISLALEEIKQYDIKFYNYALEILFSSVRDDKQTIDPLTVPISQRYDKKLKEDIIMDKIKIALIESQISKEFTKEEIRKLIRDEFEKLLKDKENKKEIAKITKEFVKKFYRELSQNSAYVVDRIEP